jgi:hypothetical protein
MIDTELTCAVAPEWQHQVCDTEAQRQQQHLPLTWEHVKAEFLVHTGQLGLHHLCSPLLSSRQASNLCHSIVSRLMLSCARLVSLFLTLLHLSCLFLVCCLSSRSDVFAITWASPIHR